MTTAPQTLFTAEIAGEFYSDQTIQTMELVRARRALEYLKTKLGEEAIIRLIQQDLDTVTARAESWAQTSDGAWKSGHVLLHMPSITSKAFMDWFDAVIAQGDGKPLRIAHPDHLLNRILPGGAEVIENLGEDALPWHFFGQFSPIDAAIPLRADAAYPIGFALTVKSVKGIIIAYALHELRDVDGGMEAKLTIVLPRAAPDALIHGHLNHFAIEFRNWWQAVANLKFRG